MRLQILIIIISLVLLHSASFADEVLLDNADKISGNIVEETQEHIRLDTKAMGQIIIKKEFVKQVIQDSQIKVKQAEEYKDKYWDKEISLGYNKTSGNTQSSQLSMRLLANKKTQSNETTLQTDMFYSSSDKKLDAQKYSGMLRYAFSFGQMQWYNFYKIQGEHDRFANIDSRVIPSSGIGYWFSDEPDFKFMSEIAIGLEHTEFRDSTKDSNESILIPRVFFQRNIFEKSMIKQDLSVYTSLADVGEYRLHSETTFSNPINDKLSLQFSLIDDYNSNPAQESHKNDARFSSSLVYSF